MQDASIGINYDIDWTPIKPTQRAGRILRFWHLPRTIEIYAFVQTLTSSTNLQYDLVGIQKKWKNLIVRPQESQKLVDWPVLTSTAASVPEREGGKQFLKQVKQMSKGVSRLHTILADGSFEGHPFMM
jgi:hypothetical protein